MRTLIAISSVAIMFAAGCATTEIATTDKPVASAPEIVKPAVAKPDISKIASAVGSDVAAIVAAAGDDAKVEFFDADGKAIDALPENASGSVSIYAADGSGQQNYAFGDDGKVRAHRVSLGDDYSAGKWTEIK